MKQIYIVVACLFCSLDCNAGGIIGLQDGLTLALVRDKGQLNTLAVVEDNGESVKAVNLSRITGIVGDIPALYQGIGYSNIVSIVMENQATSTAEYSYSELLSPAGSGDHHIGLGLNYAKHAGEVKAEERPFLFLKAVQATRQQKIATNRATLLDYEIEICARPLESIGPGESIDDIPFGFFICGDFTDRAYLMRNIDLANMQSGKGFSESKSRPGLFPTGPYMVVPVSRGAFIDQASFTLLRNDIVKQLSSLSQMTWSLETMVEQTFVASDSGGPTFSNKSNKWLPSDKITSDMVFLTGTPEGVIMRPPPLWSKVKYGLCCVVSGAMFETSVKECVVERYVEELLGAKTFLQPDERITMTGKFMGELEVTVSNE